MKSWRVLLAGVLGSLVLLALIYRPGPTSLVGPVPLAEAQGVGILSRTLCTAITAPVAGQTFCFEQTTNTLKFWTGAAWVTATATQTGVNNVRDFGAVGNGTTDDTAAFTAAIAQGASRIFVPPGTYRITSGLTLTTAQTIEGSGLPGSAINTIASVLKHDFNGDFITFTGTGTSNDAGSGGGLSRLQLVQTSGTGTGAAGIAVRLTAASATFFPARVRIDAIQIETGNGNDSFQYGILAAGIPDTTHGITDLYVSRSRIVGDANSLAAIRLENGRNVHLFENQLTGTNGHLQITGGAGANEQSSGVYVSDVSGATLALDQAANVSVVGGSWVSVTTTANTTKALLMPGIVTNTPTLLGTANALIFLNASTSELHTITATNSTVDVSGNLLKVLGSMALGTSPATSGTLRLPNSLSSVQGRNSTNGANVTMIGVDGSDRVQVAGGGATTLIGGSLMTGNAVILFGASPSLVNLQGLSASASAANNLRGACTFAAAATCAVTFASNEVNGNYFVTVTQVTGTTFDAYRISGQATTGFTINASQANSNTVNWHLIR